MCIWIPLTSLEAKKQRTLKPRISVERHEACVCGGGVQGATTRQNIDLGHSIPRSCNAEIRRHKRAICGVAIPHTMSEARD